MVSLELKIVSVGFETINIPEHLYSGEQTEKFTRLAILWKRLLRGCFSITTILTASSLEPTVI